MLFYMTGEQFNLIKTYSGECISDFALEGHDRETLVKILRTHVFCDYWSLDLDDMVIDIIKHYIPRP